MKRIFSLGLPPLLILALLTSCGQFPHEAAKSKGAERKPSVQHPNNQPLPIPVQVRVAAVRKKLAPLLENENYPGALQAIQDEIKSGLQEKTLTEEYVASLNGTIFQGEAMQKKGSFAVAGKLFQNALVAFPRDTELTSRAALVPEQLMANIDICAQELMDDGLIAYRAGNLNQAIDIWKQILSFHPQFGPAKTATETAERQLENLRSMDEGKDQDGQK